MKSQIVHLQSSTEMFQHQIQSLQDEQNEKKKLRTVAEVLTPVVKEIRSSMLSGQIPDSYYSKSMIRACLLRAQNQTISWEVVYYNRDNPQTSFNIDVFNQFESILRCQTDALRINYQTLLELLLIKIDRNEVKHDSIKNFLRY
ncbi:unnamed protein product [Didymodactylos carnosus]|uniref:Uncharacterized protein n=1 Tax=Didymodactylos carnosus TaxID=1234261 RepID=A0A8S2GY42_9BILA|nr:unnamed protein product [Didymodactylos carnosus]CAF3570974.1 unnamed protein product [Didymodactylos carnosus]